MTAESIYSCVLDFSDPEWKDENEFRESYVNTSLSFSQQIESDGIRTLSNNADDSELDGFLFVPSLPSTSSCYNLSSYYIPSNVTRLSNIPAQNYSVTALAPWINANCTKDYLASARNSVDYVMQAFLFYIPKSGTSQPPSANNQVWNLHDGGQWKSVNDYGVYAIPGDSGEYLMKKLQQYSGNVTDVPNGDLLAALYDARDYVRVVSKIQLERSDWIIASSSQAFPSLWSFLIIILLILVFIIIVTGILLRMVQRRHRLELRRRVAAGEVDLEALGLRQLTVPQEILDKMPIYYYVPSPQSENNNPEPPEYASRRSGGTSNNDDDNATTNATTTTPPIPLARTPTNISLPLDPDIVARAVAPPHAFTQTTCPICLDDFQPTVPQPSNPASGTPQSTPSIIRSLPCMHIFHPQCIDSFLLNMSSLCPLCKKTCLPRGYLPPLSYTNAMVRRERLIRRMRERVILHRWYNPLGRNDGDEHGQTNTNETAARTRTLRLRNRRPTLVGVFGYSRRRRNRNRNRNRSRNRSRSRNSLESEGNDAAVANVSRPMPLVVAGDVVPASTVVSTVAIPETSTTPSQPPVSSQWQSLRTRFLKSLSTLGVSRRRASQ